MKKIVDGIEIECTPHEASVLMAGWQANSVKASAEKAETQARAAGEARLRAFTEWLIADPSRIDALQALLDAKDRPAASAPGELKPALSRDLETTIVGER